MASHLHNLYIITSPRKKGINPPRDKLFPHPFSNQESYTRVASQTIETSGKLEKYFSTR